MKNSILTFLFFILTLIGTFWATAGEEKTYTQAELDAEVKKQVEFEFEKAMKKVGKGNLIDLSNELLKKEKEIELKELELKKLKEQLELNAKELEKKVVGFQNQQSKVLGCIDAHDKEKQKRISHMVESVSGMKPANAAEVLSVQDPDISVRILGLLGPEKVSKIFNLMDKEISARLQKQYLDMKK